MATQDTNLRKVIRNLPEVQDPFNVFPVIESEFSNLMNQLKQAHEASSAKKILTRVTRVWHHKDPNTDILELTGARIARHFPIKKMQEYVYELQLDPHKSEARIGLTEQFATKGIKGDLMIYRDVFMHAMLEVESDQITTDKLNIGLMAQKRYFDKLSEFLKEEMDSVKAKMDSINRSDSEYQTKQVVYHDQLESMRSGLRYVKDVSNIFKAKLIKTEYSTSLQELLTNPPNKELLQKILSTMLNVLIALPLATKNSQGMIDALKKIAPNLPIASFYESRMNRYKAKMLLTGHTARKKDDGTECAKSIIGSLNNISATLPLIGDPPSSQMEKACIREYAIVCIMVYHDSPIVGRLPPHDLPKRMEDSIELLGKISDEQGIVELQHAVGRILSELGR